MKYYKNQILHAVYLYPCWLMVKASRVLLRINKHLTPYYWFKIENWLLHNAISQSIIILEKERNEHNKGGV